MTLEQELHIQRLKAAFHVLVEDKYKAGAKEHGGNLWEMEIRWLLANALDEIIDGYVYLLTAIDKIDHAKQKVIDKEAPK